MSDGDSRLLHTTDRTAVVEVPEEIAAEVALRTQADAPRTAVQDALRDHVQVETEYVTPDGRNVIDAILDDDDRA
jgi:Arc/MetJ family transcription regulator